MPSGVRATNQKNIREQKRIYAKLKTKIHNYVHQKGFTGKSMRRGEMIGHRDKGEKFTKDHYREACRSIGQWMLEYNKKAVIQEPPKDHKCGSWACWFIPTRVGNSMRGWGVCCENM